MLMTNYKACAVIDKFYDLSFMPGVFSLEFIVCLKCLIMLGP